jgi:FkbM family methyltransferase
MIGAAGALRPAGKCLQVTGSSDAKDKGKRRGLLRNLREIVARLQSFDWDGLESRIADAENAFRGFDAVQRTLVDDLQRNVPRLPLISPIELAKANRFVLEARCRASTNPIYLGDHTALCRMLGLYKIYLDTTDTGFASHLLLDGFWEMWLTIFFTRTVRPGMTIIDVGANFGYYTLLFGALVGPQGRVFAVEPNPTVLPKLRRSVQLNGLAARTTIIEAAAGAAEGEASLFAPHGEPKNSAIVAAPDAIPPEWGHCYAVRQMALDGLMATVPRVDLIKIDAEGAEQDIFTGMEAILRRDKPLLLMEFNPLRYADASAFMDRLGGIYRRMRHINFDGDAVDVPAAKVLDDHSGEDWLLLFDEPALTPAPRVDALSDAAPR